MKDDDGGGKMEIFGTTPYYKLFSNKGLRIY